MKLDLMSLLALLCMIEGHDNETPHTEFQKQYASSNLGD